MARTPPRSFPTRGPGRGLVGPKQNAKKKKAPAPQGIYSGDGARVKLSREPGLTKKGLLAQPFHFAVPPNEEVRIDHAFSHTDYETIGGEQYSQAASLNLRTVSLSMMLLDEDVSYGVWEFADNPPNPLIAARHLQRLMESGTPFRLTIGQPDVWKTDDFSEPVTLRTLSVSERAGEPTTRYTDLAFTEFRRPGLLSRKREPPDYHKDVPSWAEVYKAGHVTTGEGRRIGSAEAPVTLALLAQIYYGSGSKWRTIIKAKENREWRYVTPNTPLRIYVKKKVGTRLFLPKLPKATGAKKKKDK